MTGPGRPLQPPPDVRWRAQRDQLGHAFLVGRSQRTALCGAPGWEPRWDWKVETRHEQCVEAVERMTFAALGLTQGVLEL